MAERKMVFATVDGMPIQVLSLDVLIGLRTTQNIPDKLDTQLPSLYSHNSVIYRSAKHSMIFGLKPPRLYSSDSINL